MIKRLLFLGISLLCYLEVSAQSLEHKDSTEYYMNLGFKFYQSNNDSLYHYLAKAKRFAKIDGDIATLCTLYNVESWSACYLGDIQKIRKNIIELDAIIDTNRITFNNIPDKAYYVGQTNYTKGQYHYETSAHGQASAYFDKLIKSYQTTPDSLKTADFTNIYLEGNIYQALMLISEKKYRLGEAYLQNNLRFTNQKETYAPERRNTLMHLANVRRQEGNYNQANRLIFSCIPSYGNNKNRLITAYHRIIENHLDMKQLDSASYYQKKLEAIVGEEHRMLDRFYDVSAKVATAQKDNDRALSWREKHLSFTSQKWDNAPHADIAKSYMKLGSFHNVIGNYKEALKNYTLAEQLIQRKAITLNNLEKTVSFDLSKLKAVTYQASHRYNLAANEVSKAVTILDILKPSFRNEVDKLSIIESSFPLFENGLEATYQLYKQTQQDSLIDCAFYLQEKSKSTLLLESILSTKASSFANIPEELLEQEKQLKAQITKIENSLAKRNTPQLQDQLFEVNNTYRKLQQTFEKDYPQYYTLKYDTQVRTLRDLQSSLLKKDAIISYFYGEQAIYGIALTHNSKRFIKIPLDKALITTIQESVTLFKDPYSDVKVLHEKTHKLFQTLLAPFEINAQKNLTLITDGLLNYLPFGGLATQTDGNYLIQQQSVSYAQSATLLNELKAKKNNNKKLLGFAPTFSPTNSKNLLPLPTNEREVESALHSFKGNTFTKTAATLDKFFTDSPSYSMLHLATHAIYNDEYPDQSYLAFSDSSSDEYLLYTNDLYNLNLNADLVTLSACESGVGVLRRGEGLMSLARGFYYAGASSISSTLWNINDAPSAEIMSFFYEELAQGESKNRALQKAKTRYLDLHKYDALSHPYHWAGIVISGNMESVVTASLWKLYVILGAVVFLLIMVLLRRKRGTSPAP